MIISHVHCDMVMHLPGCAQGSIIDAQSQGQGQDASLSPSRPVPLCLFLTVAATPHERSFVLRVCEKLLEKQKTAGNSRS